MRKNKRKRIWKTAAGTALGAAVISSMSMEQIQDASWTKPGMYVFAMSGQQEKQTEEITEENTEKSTEQEKETDTESQKENGETEINAELPQKDTETEISTEFTQEKAEVETEVSTDLPEEKTEVETEASTDLPEEKTEASTDFPEEKVEVETEVSAYLPEEKTKVETEVSTELPEEKTEVETEASTDLPEEKAEVETEASTDLSEKKVEVETEVSTELPEDKAEVETEVSTGLSEEKVEVETEVSTELPEEKVEVETEASIDLPEEKAEVETEVSIEFQQETEEGTELSEENAEVEKAVLIEDGEMEENYKAGEEHVDSTEFSSKEEIKSEEKKKEAESEEVRQNESGVQELEKQNESELIEDAANSEEETKKTELEKKKENKQETSNAKTEMEKTAEGKVNTTNAGQRQEQCIGGICRGQDYQISGENYAWYRDKNDMLWVRKDTSLIIEPTAETGYNRKIMTENLKEDGLLKFALEQVNEDGKVLDTSAVAEENYYVDGEVPAADISVAGNVEGDQIYSKDGKINVVVPPDTQSGLKQTAYCIVSADQENDLQSVSGADWKICGEREDIQWDQEGTYRIYVRTEDQVGNVAFSQSEVFMVDHTAPKVKIEGVCNQSANAGKTNIQIDCTDEGGGQRIQKAEIRGLNNGIVIQPQEITKPDGTISLSYEDFPKDKVYDDIYEMILQVEDLAGNQTEEKVQFSVNRCGSVYNLAEETRAQLEKYYLQNGFDLVIYETNVDYVGESRIFCRRDGRMQELVRDQDYQVGMEGTDKTWKQYKYTISPEILGKEGIYEFLLTSTDAANNSTDTSIQEKKICFAIDRTAPEYFISGLEEKGIYQAKQKDIYLTASDNVCLSKVRIYRDSRLWKEVTGSELSEWKDGLLISLEEKEEWQTMQVYLEDASGNFCWSREIPFYLSANADSGNVPVYKKIKRSAEEQSTAERLKTAAVTQGYFDRYRERILLWTGAASLVLASVYCLVESLRSRQMKLFPAGKRRKR